MSGHLCLKWNNHSSAFLKSISNIHIKERYCDATIACQGKYFPVHRVVLSTCSDYFDEMFERMQCQHPYIVFKDIEPREMELLLNYMYQGEVNVVQEMLPTLIKAAEALKVKGLAVPDDMPSNKDSSGKKRSNTSNDNPQPKRRLEESKRRRRHSSEQNPLDSLPNADELDNYPNNESEMNHSDTSSLRSIDPHIDSNESRLIKEEPVDPSDYGEGSLASSTQPVNKEEIFANFPVNETYIKTENMGTDQPYDEQSSSWSDFGSGSVLPNLPTSEMGGPDDIAHSDTGSISITKVEVEMVPSPEASLPSSSAAAEIPITSPAPPTPVVQEFQGRLGPTVGPSPYASRGDLNPTSRSLHHCLYCEYQTNNPKNLKTHTYRHTGERPFPCSLCPARFIKKVDLENHVRDHTGERPYQCTRCLVKFKVKDHLKKHLNKKFKCFKAV